MEQNVLYQTPFGKHLVILAAMVALITLLPIFLLSPDPFSMLRNADILKIIGGTILLVMAISTGSYLLFQLWTYRKLIFVNNRVTLVNLFGKEVSFKLDHLVKVTPSRAAYIFHVGPPHEKVYILYCYMGPEKFERILEQISRKRMGTGSFTFEYGSTVREF
jgi:hypothetical protein